ncbi:MAG: hypothetical protein ACT4QC_23030, partial [Planctomycetaceae bacterium]
MLVSTPFRRFVRLLASKRLRTRRTYCRELSAILAAEVQAFESRELLSAPVAVSNLDPQLWGSTGSVAIGNTLYFKGYDSAHGSELWKSD